MKKIALVIKTEGLEYDDRIRKEIITVQKLFPDVCFKIFAMLPGNKEAEGETKYGVPFKSVYVPARDKYPSATKTTLKAWQFYQAVKKEVMRYDAVWVANVDAAFVPIFLPHKRILWDLHELPLQFTGNWLMRQLLRRTFNRCKVVLHANPQRVDYLYSIGVIKDRSKHFALRNYPNFDDVDSEHDEAFKKFLQWKGERKCVYLQGLSEERRAAYESVAAVLQQGKLAAVVVGKMFPGSLERLKREFGEEILNERILFVGKIAQLKIPQYVAECHISLVFYKNVQPNNWYCEANRFYQSVILGLPVVTGNNPSMKVLVEKYNFGVSIDDDGSNIVKIVDGMNQVLNNYEKYKQNTIDNRDKLLWKNQEDVIKEIIEKLFLKAMKKLVFIMAGMGNPNNIKRIEEAIARGFEVDVYAFDGQRDGPRDPEGVEVHMLPGYTSDLPYWKRIGKVVTGLRSVIKNYHKDECVYYLFRNDKAIIFNLLTNRPYIFEEADMTHANIKNSFVRNWFERRLRTVIKQSVISAFRSEGFLQYHFGDNRPKNVYVIPNRLHAGILNIPAVEYTGFDEEHLRFGFVGGIRYDTIYKFAETMLKHFPQHEFHFYGMFPNEKQEKQFMPLDKYANCFFHGAFRNPDELPEIYSKIDVLLSAYDVTAINPRYAEPNKLYEAIYFDKPIIVSSNSFLADKVKRLGVGYDVDALNECAIVDLINMINAEGIANIKRNIAKIDKNSCINDNEAFFTFLKNNIS